MSLLVTYPRIGMNLGWAITVGWLRTTRCRVGES